MDVNNSFNLSSRLLLLRCQCLNSEVFYAKSEESIVLEGIAVRGGDREDFSRCFLVLLSFR